MADELPAAGAVDEDVGEAEVELSGVAFVGAFEVLKAGDHGGVLVDLDVHVGVFDDGRFEIAGGEHGEILGAGGFAAGHDADGELLSVEIFEEAHVGGFSGCGPVVLELEEGLLSGLWLGAGRVCVENDEEDYDCEGTCKG